MDEQDLSTREIYCYGYKQGQKAGYKQALLDYIRLPMTDEQIAKIMEKLKEQK